VLAGDAPFYHLNLEIEALMLDGLARGSHASVERALALAEPQGRMWMIATIPGVADLLRDHRETAHGAFVKDLLDHLGGQDAQRDGAPAEPLTDRELAVLRFLPTNLSATDIGKEMYLSVHTVKTYMRRLYTKLDAHTRAEAVQRARAAGLLGPGRR
jgi:LuxR family maltose regulon positive regulatory protein